MQILASKKKRRIAAQLQEEAKKNGVKLGKAEVRRLATLKAQEDKEPEREG